MIVTKLHNYINTHIYLALPRLNRLNLLNQIFFDWVYAFEQDKLVNFNSDSIFDEEYVGEN